MIRARLRGSVTFGMFVLSHSHHDAVDNANIFGASGHASALLIGASLCERASAALLMLLRQLVASAKINVLSIHLPMALQRDNGTCLKHLSRLSRD